MLFGDLVVYAGGCEILEAAQRIATKCVPELYPTYSEH